jgi:hypothetical protein
LNHFSASDDAAALDGKFADGLVDGMDTLTVKERMA